MKKTTMFILAAVLISGLSSQAAMKVSQDQYVTGEFNLYGPFYLRNVEVTATAAELNALDASITTAATIGSTNVTLTAKSITAAVGTTVITSTNYTFTASDLNKLWIVNTNAAVSLTLPTNTTAAGNWIQIAVKSTTATTCVPTVSSGIADTLVGPSDADLDSVTYGTNTTGALMYFWADGAAWHVQNLSPNTMTYTD
jgi:hypothetical protein